jgi:hypothetical protein
MRAERLTETIDDAGIAAVLRLRGALPVGKMLAA